MHEFLHLHHASILVDDLGQSKKFYIDVLGFSVNPARPDLGYPGLWLDIGEQQIHLIQLPGTSNNTGHGGRDRHIAIAVRGLDQLIAKLKHAEIAFTKSKSGRQALFCRDPDGNALEFIEIS